MIDEAVQYIDIAMFYMTLLEGDPAGQAVFTSLQRAAQRGVSIRIVQNQPSPSMPDDDVQLLAIYPNVRVRSLDLTKLIGAGILHTKLIIADAMSVYVGSANMDWRSLAQVSSYNQIVELDIVYNHDILGRLKNWD